MTVYTHAVLTVCMLFTSQKESLQGHWDGRAGVTTFFMFVKVTVQVHFMDHCLLLVGSGERFSHNCLKVACVTDFSFQKLSICDLKGDMFSNVFFFFVKVRWAPHCIQFVQELKGLYRV